jgi:hypothetical protein
LKNGGSKAHVAFKTAAELKSQRKKSNRLK